MTFSFNVGLSPTTGSIAIYELKQQLKAVGWTVPRSSDGTTYNSSGDEITSGATGAGGLANNFAWFVIRSPVEDGYQREFCIQRSNTSNTNFRIKYSQLGIFTSGSPGATQTPSATDEGVILGSGTDASPTFAALYSTDNTYKYHIITGGASENYSFYAIAVNNGGSAVNSIFLFDRMATSSYAPEDSDPYVIHALGSASTLATLTNISICPLAWYRKGLSGESFVRTPAANYIDSGGSTFIGAGGSNAWNGYDDGLPILYGRTSSLGGNTGFKGISKFLYWKIANRSNGDTISITSSKDKIVFGDVIFPWDGSSPVI